MTIALSVFAYCAVSWLAGIRIVIPDTLTPEEDKITVIGFFPLLLPFWIAGNIYELCGKLTTAVITITKVMWGSK